MALVEHPQALVRTEQGPALTPVAHGTPRRACFATSELSAGDRDAVLDLFSRSSPQTRRDRFHLNLSVMPGQYLDEILDRRQLALVARECGAPEEGPRIIALASAANLTPEVAEVAIWVGDSWQRRGVGAALTRMLLRELAHRGLRSAVGFIEPGNSVVLRFLDRVAPCHSLRVADGLLAAEIPLGPFLDAAVPARCA
ncbi:hypothetical protein GCM10009798_40530 [Nocardioides panacihumi]|uniref:N-acetyltransferase domain-containing protein n=1 Tax=Nocardioides panacihumi TaxID=400774 RepID=A0ABN2RUL2_9ACTN